jgi:hypothetical protein
LNIEDEGEGSFGLISPTRSVDVEWHVAADSDAVVDELKKLVGSRAKITARYFNRSKRLSADEREHEG